MIVCCEVPLSQEIAMTQSDTRAWPIRAAFTVTLSGSMMAADVALASQGPGGGMERRATSLKC